MQKILNQKLLNFWDQYFMIMNFLFPTFCFFLKQIVNFSHFGQLVNMTDLKAQSLLISLILITVVILRMILKPWAEFPDRAI
ncbi:unnamed protein product [Paramecium primaurelia]|uniref:Uncharacterized protein n=1 Tax=Paramecium primaurelia TaxID=5886 RepID=A0A8S1MUG8_PARPR|nr:unnamed protein product [Paramecium primaurelia]